MPFHHSAVSRLLPPARVRISTPCCSSGWRRFGVDVMSLLPIDWLP